MSAPDDPEDAGPDAEDAEKEAPGGVTDAPMRASIVSVFFCGLIFAVVGFAFWGPRAGFGVAVGGLIATANLWVFARVGQAFMSQKGASMPWTVIALLKMVVLFGGVWWILHTGAVSGLSLVAGYAALPFGITLASLFGPKPAENDVPPSQSAHGRRDVIKGRRPRGGSSSDGEP